MEIGRYAMSGKPKNPEKPSVFIRVLFIVWFFFFVASSHILQHDNEMLIHGDCPSPIDREPPTDFAMVANGKTTNGD